MSSMSEPGGIPRISHARPDVPEDLRADLAEDLLPQPEAHRDPADEVFLRPGHARGVGARDLEEQPQEQDPAFEGCNGGVVAAQPGDVDPPPVAVRLFDQPLDELLVPRSERKVAAEEVLQRLHVGGAHLSVRVRDGNGQADQAGEEVDLRLGDRVLRGPPGAAPRAEEAAPRNRRSSAARSKK